MGDTKVGERKIIIAQMRVTFLEYPPMLPDEILEPEKYDKRLGGNPKKMDVIYGDDVSEFTDSVSGTVWYMPDAGKAALLFDQIAQNKGMALKLETGSTVERLREAEKNKAVLAFVELAVLEATQAYISGDHGTMTSPYKDARNLDTVRLNGCRVVATKPMLTSKLQVHFKAKSAQSRSRGGGGGCPPWACGSNHNENFVLDIED
jgi:hypothetical protein